MLLLVVKQKEELYNRMNAMFVGTTLETETPFSLCSYILSNYQMFAVKKLITPLKTVARIGKMNISSTSALFEKFNILVPPMGESIKNGIYNQLE